MEDKIDHFYLLYRTKRDIRETRTCVTEGKFTDLLYFCRMDAKSYYQKTVAEAVTAVSHLSSISRAVSWSRITIFLLTIAAIFVLWDNTALAGSIAVVGTVIFLFLVKYHDSILRKRAVQEARKAIAESRLRVIDGDLSRQPQGNSHIDPMHPFTYDIDVFGRSSLFSMLDSTATPMGAKKLADWLISPLDNADDIIKRQQAIKELSTMNELRTQFHATGIALDGDADSESRPMPDFSHIPSFRLPLWQRIIAVSAFPLFLAVLSLAVSGIIPGITVMWLSIIYLAIAALSGKRTSRLHEWMNTTVSALTARVDLFRNIEQTDFHSSLLKSLSESLGNGDTPASVMISRMAGYLKSFDQRLNAAGFMLFNGTALWDLVTIYLIDRWMNRNRGSLARWQSVLGEIDALCALATYAFENPHYTFPEIDPTGNTIMKATGIGHPLIHHDKRVNNPLPCMGKHSFIIVTGANMAGKSTYLRTVGINYLLATIGAPVAAESMIFSPVKLFTGLRAADSLADGESYFFAELRRLQAVVNEASQGRPMFILLDEILRGTNSADKQRGSLALVRKLVTLPVAGILATHDLALGILAEEYPENVSAYCFEAEIKDDNLTFDYRIRRGIAHNLNAYFLMERMGIV